MFKTLVAILIIGLLGILPLMANAELVAWKFQGGGYNGRCSLDVRFDTVKNEMVFEPSFYAPSFVGSFPDTPRTVSFFTPDERHELAVKFAIVRPHTLGAVWMEHRYHMPGFYVAPEHCANMQEIR